VFVILIIGLVLLRRLARGKRLRSEIG
jgi:hypothetical protein